MTTLERIRLAAFLLGAVALIFDYMQTRSIAKNPGVWYENNFFLGKHPSLDKVNTYFAVVLAGYALVYLMLALYVPILGAAYAGVVFGWELVVVAKKRTLGIPFDLFGRNRGATPDQS